MRPIRSNRAILLACAIVTVCIVQTDAQAQTNDRSSDGSIFDAYLVGDGKAIQTSCESCGGGGCNHCCPKGEDSPYPPAPSDYAPAPEDMTTPPLQMDPDFVFAPAQGTLLAQSRVPVMIGDFFGPVVGTSGETDSDGSIINFRTGGSAGFQSGRQKIVENTSPVPQNRVFFNYSYFDNVPLIPGGMPVNRFTPGFEKTFFDGNISFEARFPFSSTLASEIDYFNLDATNDGGPVAAQPNTNTIEFGNVTLYLKGLLYADNSHAISAGLGITLPTANDNVANVRSSAGLDSSIIVENESVHLLPFLGGVYMPNDRFFAQAFVQIDVDTNGNPVFISESPTNDSPVFARQRLGRVNDPTFLYADVGVGYWMYRNECCDACLTGFAPRFELHYNTSVSDPDTVPFSSERGPNFNGEVTTGSGHFETINALVGTTFEIQHDSSLTVAYVVPVGGGSDQVFDGELRVLLNYFYGPSPRRYGAPTTGFAR